MDKIIEHTTGRSIYRGTLMSIAGSVRLTNPKSGKSKYFIVCHICPTPLNRDIFGKAKIDEERNTWHIILSSEISGMTQKKASMLPQISKTDLTAPVYRQPGNGKDIIWS